MHVQPVPLTVLIATAGERGDLLHRTLCSLAQCTPPPEYQGLLIVENGPPGSARVCVDRADPWLRAEYLHIPQPGKSQAINAALERLTPGLVVFLDDDILASPDLLTAYADAAAEATEDGGGFFGGPIDPDYEATPAPWLTRFLPASARGWRLNDPSELGSRCFIGLNWAAFRGDLLAIGGFDANYGPGQGRFGLGEETLAQDQMRARGIPGRYVPKAHVQHWVPAGRCSAEWVVHREYQRSACKALARSTTASGRAKIRTRLLGRVATGLFWRLLSTIRPSSRWRFQADRHRAIVQGLREGLTAKG